MSIGGVGLARSGGLGLGLSQPRLALPPGPGFSGLSGPGLVGSDGEVAGCATGISRSGMSSLVGSDGEVAGCATGISRSGMSSSA